MPVGAAPEIVGIDDVAFRRNDPLGRSPSIPGVDAPDPFNRRIQKDRPQAAQRRGATSIRGMATPPRRRRHHVGTRQRRRRPRGDRVRVRAGPRSGPTDRPWRTWRRLSHAPGFHRNASALARRPLKFRPARWIDPTPHAISRACRGVGPQPPCRFTPRPGTRPSVPSGHVADSVTPCAEFGCRRRLRCGCRHSMPGHRARAGGRTNPHRGGRDARSGPPAMNVVDPSPGAGPAGAAVSVERRSSVRRGTTRPSRSPPGLRRTRDRRGAPDLGTRVSRGASIDGGISTPAASASPGRGPARDGPRQRSTSGPIRSARKAKCSEFARTSSRRCAATRPL